MTQQTPPYLRIVDDIRGRIAAGELRPGDQVPSARRITQDWGVALATATKVLATLSADGLTRAVPGIGTVVAAPEGVPAPAPGRPARAESELTRERIVRTAIAIADAEGIAQLSMRRIATELGGATMSLYRHVGSKEELVIYMIDAALGEEPLPKPPPAGWRARLELSSRVQWKLFRRHPWLAPALSMNRPQLIPNGMLHTEWALAALDGHGLSLTQAMNIHIVLFGLGRGLALNLETEAQAEQDTGLTSDEWMQLHEGEFAEVMAHHDFPLMRRLLGTEFDLDLDGLYEFGLARTLDGLDHYLAALPS
jgi:AcrR family transcriptional regulator